jgi:hypothetical protein
MTDLMVANTLIRKDSNNLYCLNDLHKASGGANKDKPSRWLRSKQTQALIFEIEIAQIRAISSVQNIGTFAVKELVYAYAMWISPSFYLHVVRTYDAVVTGHLKISPADAKMLEITRINPNTLKAISGTRNNATVRANYLALVGAGILEEVTELKPVTHYRFTLDGLGYCAGYYHGIPRFDDQKHALVIGLINEFANRQLTAQSDLFVSVA